MSFAFRNINIMSINKVILLGYVGADPEVRYPEKDRPIATLSLATNDYFGQNGKEFTEWHRLVLGGSNATLAEKYIRKGTRLYIEGKLRTRSFEDKFKITRKITEIIVERLELLGRKDS